MSRRLRKMEGGKELEICPKCGLPEKLHRPELMALHGRDAVCMRLMVGMLNDMAQKLNEQQAQIKVLEGELAEERRHSTMPRFLREAIEEGRHVIGRELERPGVTWGSGSSTGRMPSNPQLRYYSVANAVTMPQLSQPAFNVSAQMAVDYEELERMLAGIDPAREEACEQP